MEAVRLLERTGLQYIVAELKLDEAVLNQPAVFFTTGREKTVNTDNFHPYLIAPKENRNGEFFDAHQNPIPAEHIFQIMPRLAIDAYKGKWIPLPYNARALGEGHEIDSNDWVRLHFDARIGDHGIEVKAALCIDTDVYTQQGGQGYDADHCPLLPHTKNTPIRLAPRAVKFCKSAPLKAWIEKAGRDITPADEKDQYPCYSHYLTLLSALERVLPPIEVSDPVGIPVDVHLFIDVGNSRTCGVVVETQDGHRFNPENAFEKLQIRQHSSPTDVGSEPFETRCMFMPSPFDFNYYPVMHSPNFRNPSIMRIGREASWGEWNHTYHGRCRLSSPKRYIWSERLNPTPWFFGVSPLTQRLPVISDDILNHIAEDGAPRWLTKAPPWDEPCFPNSSMVTFFMLEVLSQAYSQVNSWEYRGKRANNICRRTIKTIVVTTPNGMVKTERDLYLKRVLYAVDLFWKKHDLPEGTKPAIKLGYDEASCAQLVYMYSLLQEKMKGDPQPAFDILGRRRAEKGTPFGESKSIRIASIDIGGGTSDLMITEYRNRGTHGVNLQAKSLFQEGVSVAGDEVLRILIRDVVMKDFLLFTDEWYGAGEVTMDHLETFFGPRQFKPGPEFLEMKKRVIDAFWIPIAFKYLEHSQFCEGPEVESKDFIELELPQPNGVLSTFFTQTLSEIVGVEKGIHVNLFNTRWNLDRTRVNNVIYHTLKSTLRTFAEIISQLDCDIILVAGKMSAMPEISNMLIEMCPVPPNRIVSLTGFEAGNWYPFDTEKGKIKDAKTTVTVGAALWFFSEERRLIPNFNLTMRRDELDRGSIFIGQVNNRIVKDAELLFPRKARNLSLSGITYLGARRVDFEHSHANMLYEIRFGGREGYTTPITVTFRQDAQDKSLLSIQSAMDATGKQLSNLSMSLRTLEDELHWVDSGSIFD